MSTLGTPSGPGQVLATSPGPVSWPERLVRWLTEQLGPPTGSGAAMSSGTNRRSLLRRATLIATALVVNPFDFLLRPTTAYASVCGPANECAQGWTAFCCTINDGANTCPDGSYAAGWWKVSSSAFCRGEDRYIVDCNRSPDASCTCSCADGDCDRRRVCCNNFRYGQCNQQVPGVTQVVCRVVICTPPWEWDPTCTTTVRTDERTRDHSATCLPGTDPTEIDLAYLDAGLAGSTVGARLSIEETLPDGGSWQQFAAGAITRTPTSVITIIGGPTGVAYRDSGGPAGPLGYPLDTPTPIGRGTFLPLEDGIIYAGPDGPGIVLDDRLRQAYDLRGGPLGWLGFPVVAEDAPGNRRRIWFEAGWSLARDRQTNAVKLVPGDVELPGTPGEWPLTADVMRVAGNTRLETAVAVSLRAHTSSAPLVVLAAADTFADALSGGVLAGIAGGPVLLTSRSHLDDVVAGELRRLAPAEVLLVGGPQVLSEQVSLDVADVLPQTEVGRLAGDDRFATAVAVADEVAARTQGMVSVRQMTVFIASGRSFPDALAATPAGVGAGAPILLTEPDRLPAATADALRRMAPDRVVLLGGEQVISSQVEQDVLLAAAVLPERIAGTGRADTAVEIAREFGPAIAPRLMVATGDGFPDALAAGAGAAAIDSPLLLVGTSTLPRATRLALADLQPEVVLVVGGEGAVDGTVIDRLQASPVGPYEERANPV